MTFYYRLLQSVQHVYKTAPYAPLAAMMGTCNVALNSITFISKPSWHFSFGALNYMSSDLSNLVIHNGYDGTGKIQISNLLFIPTKFVSIVILP